MKYAQVYEADCANGPGCRTSFFVSGCTHHCKGCFNPETWDFNFGLEYTPEVEDKIVDTVRPSYIEGLTILGGEPMEPLNQRSIKGLIKKIKDLNKSVWVYSGYTFEELSDPSNDRCHCEVTDDILSMIDVLVDGEFHLEEKDITLKFRGSKNQRIIDIKKTLREGKIILIE